MVQAVLGEVDLDVAVLEAVGDGGHLQLHDRAELLAGQRAEDDNVVEAIQELRAEVTADGSHDLASDILGDACIAPFLLALLVAARAAVARRVLVIAQVTFVGGESKKFM